MGLDSVELLMQMEEYFNIHIPNAEAETISTVKKMVDCIAKHLNVTSVDRKLYDWLYQKLESALMKLQLITTSLQPDSFIFQLLQPNEHQQWQALEQLLELGIPRPQVSMPKQKKFVASIINAIGWSPFYDSQTITVEQFITAICAHNSQALINPNHIDNLYEIYVAVVAITVEKIGVDVYEVTPYKSFTDDLGID